MRPWAATSLLPNGKTTYMPSILGRGSWCLCKLIHHVWRGSSKMDPPYVQGRFVFNPKFLDEYESVMSFSESNHLITIVYMLHRSSLCSQFASGRVYINTTTPSHQYVFSHIYLPLREFNLGCIVT